MFAAVATPAMADPSSDVVGGTEVPFASHDWDFITQVIVSDGVDDYFVCGGSLIRREWVLTAAHCTDAGLPISYVVTGAKSFYSGYPTGVDNVIVHPDYDPATGENDIALLHLKTPPFAAPLTRLATPDSDPTAPDSVRVAGWGDTAFGSGLGSDQLLEADVEVVNNQDCNDAYQGLPDPATIFDSMICAAHFDGANSRDTCQGDSGGPMVEDQVDGPTLVGLTQGGEGCAEAPYPGIYTRISSKLAWIDSYIGSTAAVVPQPLGPWMDLPPGRTSTFSVTVRNPGPNEIRFSPAKVVGNGFSIAHDLCGGGNPYLAPGAICYLGVNFSPTAVGNYDGELQLPTDSISQPVLSMPIHLTSAPPAKLGLLFARGFGGLTKNQGRVLRLSKKSSPVVQIAFEAKIPPSVNPEMPWRRCAGQGAVEVRYPGIKKIYRGAISLSGLGDGHCFAVAYVKLAKHSLGKRVKVTATTAGSYYTQPASFRGTLRIAKKVK